MRLIQTEAEPAIVIRCEDTTLQRYMQEYPFLQGPRSQLNRRILAELPGMTELRRPSRGTTVERLARDETALSPDVFARTQAMLRAIGIVGDGAAAVYDKLAWKVRDVPVDTRSILAVGSGAGLELVFLRAAAPDAQIVALDWVSTPLPGLAEVVGAEFRSANVFEFLEQTEDTFDVVFSNHVLEHMYQPEHFLAVTRGRIAPSGRMIAGLPVDGQGVSFSDTLARLSGVKRLSWVDFGSIDLGHPWKTTPADLHDTFVKVGFDNVRLAQREHHLTVMLSGGEGNLAVFRSRGLRLQRLLLRPLKSMVAHLAGPHPPQLVMRSFYAFERRIWFGANPFKNREAPEILLVAQ